MSVAFASYKHETAPSSKVIKKTNKAGYEVQLIGYWCVEAARTNHFELFIPPTAPKKPPLVVGFHGVGGVPELLLDWPQMCELATKYGFLVLSTFGYHHSGWYGARGSYHQEYDNAPENLGDLAESDVINAIGIVRKQYNVDPHRMYAIGQSMGGAAVVHYASKYPDYFAAIATACPNTWCLGQVATGPETLKTLKDIPIIVVHGTHDNLVNCENDVRPWIQHMKDLELNYKYLEIESAGHMEIGCGIGFIKEAFDHFSKHAKKEPAPPIVRPSVLLHFRGYNLPEDQTKGPDDVPSGMMGIGADEVTWATRELAGPLSQLEGEEFAKGFVGDKKLLLPSGLGDVLPVPYVNKSKKKAEKGKDYPSLPLQTASSRLETEPTEKFTIWV